MLAQCLFFLWLKQGFFDTGRRSLPILLSGKYYSSQKIQGETLKLTLQQLAKKKSFIPLTQARKNFYLK
jgi:hypothetical protein